MPRTTKEWRGKTDDSKAPPRVRQRVFDSRGGKCHWCGLPIKVPGETWQVDHVAAIINGGPNREDNLAPIHSHCHVAKTGDDVADKKKVAKVRAKHTGAIRPKGKLRSAGFPATEKSPKSGKAMPPRRSLFVRIADGR